MEQVWLLIAALPLLVYLYARWNDATLRRMPPRVLAKSPHRCSPKDIRTLANNIERAPITVLEQMPPKTGRHYIVVGGAGFVGGWIVLQLIQRGEDPRKIRVLDIRSPTRRDLTSGLARDVDFMRVDIRDTKAVEKAFKAPWPTSNALDSEPQITVFHTAANIRYYERHPFLLPYSATVNIDGTRNVINAMRSVGANVLVYTSSGTISVHNSRFWLWPWEKEPNSFFQVINDDDNLIPKRHNDFFSNYAVTKFQAERIVREADRSVSRNTVLRTGCIRPGNGVFGPGGDISTSVYLQRKSTPSWASSILQPWVYVENCSLAHLCYEQRLLESLQGGNNPDIGGQAFCVTDPGAPLTFGDLCLTLTTLTNGETCFPPISPTLILLMSHIVELYYLTRHFLLSSASFIGSRLPALEGELMCLQPSVFALTGVHTICDDSRARLAPEMGGLGYKGAWTTLEGLHRTVEEYRNSSKREAETAKAGNVSVMFDVGLVGSKKGTKITKRTGRGFEVDIPN